MRQGTSWTKQGRYANISCRIGVISDTHGLLRPEVADYLQGVDCIIHAGDVCSREIPQILEGIAPFYGVRGNNDSLYCGLPATRMLTCDGDRIYVLHQLPRLAIDPAACGVKAVVYGHTHYWARDERDGVLYVNAGSIGPRRFHYPVTLGYLLKIAGKWSFEVVFLEGGPEDEWSRSGLRL